MLVKLHLRQAAIRAQRSLGYRAWSMTPEGRANTCQVEALAGRYAGRRCVIMGNGPSLLESDLASLSSEITIVSNAHYLMWDQIAYVPTFLSVEDVLVAEDRAEELRGLQGTTCVFPYDLRHLLGPANAQRVYLNFVREYKSFPRFSNDLARRAFFGGTVSFLNLQLAAFLGCNPIILIGFDHSYTVPHDEVEDLVIRSRTADVNHFHPNYFGPGYRWHDPNVQRMETAYVGALHALTARGIRVYNATAGGKLEVFERATLPQLLDEHDPRRPYQP